MRSRELAWDACLNVRDLGSHPFEDGGTTCFGAYVRADNIERLTDEGWRALVDYGVRTVVDLRLAEERKAPTPEGLPVLALHRPLVADFGHPDWDELNALSLGAALPESTRIVYLEFLERYRGRFGQAVSTIASAGETGTVLFHCMGGKDRYGTDRGSAAAGRRVSNGRQSPTTMPVPGETSKRCTTAWIVGRRGRDRPRACASGSAPTPAEAMLGVLETLDERYGGVEGYLQAAGVDDEALTAIRARLARMTSVVAIFGPTASGKSAVAEALARPRSPQRSSRRTRLSSIEACRS